MAQSTVRTNIREQVLAGAVAPDYANDRFTSFQAPTPAPAPMSMKASLPPMAPPIAIDTLLADTLERNLHPIKVTSLLEHTTRAALIFAMRRTHGNQSRAADILGIGRYTLGKWCVKFRVDPLLFGGTSPRKKTA